MFSTSISNLYLSQFPFNISPTFVKWVGRLLPRSKERLYRLCSTGQGTIPWTQNIFTCFTLECYNQVIIYCFEFCGNVVGICYFSVFLPLEFYYLPYQSLCSIILTLTQNVVPNPIQTLTAYTNPNPIC